MAFFAKQIEEGYEDAKIVLAITKDFMKAYLMIKTDNININISKEFLVEFLKKHNVIYGVQENNIEEIGKLSKFNSSIEVAKGDNPISGEDGFIKYHFDRDRKIQAKLDEEGKINFKELNFVENIKKGQILAEKFLPKQGIDGINIFGEKVKANKGKDINLKFGKNVELSADSLKIISSCDGRIEFNDGKISINTVLDIKGNIDSSTGNIRFNGDVVVYGDIKSGFSVEADGSIQVNGVIEGANVKARGNLIVKSGIQGTEKGTIFSGGNLICKYIENSNIICEGDLTTDFIVHSHIICNKSINVVGGKGLIAGGEIKAKNEVKANIIGSPMGTKTNIEVGFDPKTKDELKSYIEEKKSVEKSLKDLSLNINSFKELIKRGALDAKSKESFIKSIETYNQFSEKFEMLNKNIQLIESQIQSSTEGVIIVNKKIFPGVRINVGFFTKYIQEETKYAKFYIEDKDLVMRSL